MSGMTDGQQLRNAQWGKVSRLFKPAMIISATLAASAETLYRTGVYPRAIFEAGSADARTWLYVALMYLIAFPVLFLWMRRLLAGYPMPWNPPLKRWLLGAFSLILCSGMIVLPVIVLTVGGSAAGRGKGLYQLFTGSLFGTFLVGTVLAYAAALGAWLLFIGTPKLLFPKLGSR
ncbi:transporter [Stenotrophomonas maltophilia]|uniref:transporter n=1 Tax=Stenotrophomonas TaxID=40323 RepID=UPI0013105D1F|nr:transporter [Stenotrophomonas maltophilia]MBA0224468.1 transporter [Stenotrophomonas maltophilia]MBA0365698.1 transporter [Stenotrophomonas maltophilia]MBA0402931.1 transporter [Stenotrophomonas maltophilia]MCF3521431.1 transporter [Stenotrophomonas maltophilia]